MRRRTGPSARARPPGRARRPAGLEGGDLAIGAAVIAILALTAWQRMRAFVVGENTSVHVALLAVLLALVAGAVGGAVSWRRRRPPSGKERDERASSPSEGWANGRQLKPLMARAEPGDRLVLGRFRRGLVAAERLQSVLVVGPSQSGKTTSLAIPALLAWRGPVLATSVKTDLVRDTVAARSLLGETALFDPTGATGLEGVGWSPLAGATSWAGARRVASSLCSVGRREGGIEDASFWYAAAERLLAPLLRAAVLAGSSMGEVLRWLDEESANEPLLALEIANEEEASRVARSCFAMEERQRSSVYATAQTILAAYGDPVVSASERFGRPLSAGWLLDGESRSLYCCAPAREQARLSPIFVALVREVLDAAFERANNAGSPLDPPLLVVLDEAANIAPLADLDQLIATAAGHGIVFLTVWQDLAQIEGRYGSGWATIVNNHKAKVVCPGVSDPRTLELLSALIGDVEIPLRSQSRAEDGSWSETESPTRVPVAPAGWIRRLPDGHCLVVYGALPPALVQMRPWFAATSGRRRLAQRGEPGAVSGQPISRSATEPSSSKSGSWW